jgi:hypothetical protein
VRRQDRELLLEIRSGAFSYEELVSLANEKTERINTLFEKSTLPEYPDYEAITQLLFEIRDTLYR